MLVMWKQERLGGHKREYATMRKLSLVEFTPISDDHQITTIGENECHTHPAVGNFTEANCVRNNGFWSCDWLRTLLNSR